MKRSFLSPPQPPIQKSPPVVAANAQRSLAPRYQSSSGNSSEPSCSCFLPLLALKSQSHLLPSTPIPLWISTRRKKSANYFTSQWPSVVHWQSTSLSSLMSAEQCSIPLYVSSARRSLNYFLEFSFDPHPFHDPSTFFFTPHWSRVTRPSSLLITPQCNTVTRQFSLSFFPAL